MPMIARVRQKWRKWFRAIHRDLGYIAVALTLAYAISGFAVNHLDDWNPNYRFENRVVEVGPLPVAADGQPDALQAMQNHVVAALGINPRSVKGHFQESPIEFRVFLVEAQEVRVDIRTGHGVFKALSRRRGLFELNTLHLNALKGVWTYIADGFAIALMVLAITGMTMMKGDRGLGGRGKWFVLAGLAIPVSAIVYMYW
jgi:hypothetical protein